MTEREPTADEMVDAIYAFAGEQMDRGVPNGVIQTSLIERGLDQELATAVILNLTNAEAAARQAVGKQNMMYGAFWCLLGIGVTVYTRLAATGGGIYLVFWGAIAFGAIQFFRGVAHCNS